MTTPKTFHHPIAQRSHQEPDQASRPDPAESISAEEAWELPYLPHAIHDDAMWQRPMNIAPRAQMMLGLQQHIGNQAVQRLVAQRRGDGSFTVDDDAQARIHRERGGGQPLDRAAQVQMSRSIGHDFSDVRVHTSAEADEVSRQLGAIAFTTGHDIFFRAGKYDPSSSSGQELLAHELTHVVQQSSGAMATHQRMTVNPPDDAYEQAADAVARQVMSAAPYQHQSHPSTAVSDVQREAQPEEEEELQTKLDPSAVIQRQAAPEEEEEIQTKVDPGAAIQREAQPEEEEELQTKLDPSAVIQRQETPEEEEEIQAKVDPAAAIQRQDDATDVVAPPNVPSISGTAELTSLNGGDPYFDQAFGKWAYNAEGLTTAEFLAPTFTTIGEKASPAKGCSGCNSKDCFRVSATAIITFDVDVNVNLPRGSDFTDLKKCEQKQVQAAIDRILKPHEQKHVAAFKTYKGTVTRPVSTLACRADVESGAALTTAGEAIASAEGSTRGAKARAASDKLDPFELNVDLKNCEDKQSLGSGSDQSQPSDVAYA